MGNWETIHVEPDTHVPFHDEKAWGLNLKVAEERQPTHYIKLGDWLDVYSLSRHQKDPGVAKKYGTIKDELEVGNAMLDVQDRILRRTKNKVYIMGNHEARFDAYIANKAPELFGMTSIEEGLNLKKRGWKVVPYREAYSLGHITYTHDAGSHGGNAHLDAERVHCGNIVIGHTHRLGYAIVGNRKGKPHLAMMCGWLGDFKAANYIHQAVSNRWWSHGFAAGRMNPKTGVTYLSPVPMINYTACVDGVVYEGGR